MGREWTDRTVRLQLYRCSGVYQISIGDSHTGNRLMGPKFMGTSQLIGECKIDQYSAREIIRWCEQAIAEAECEEQSDGREG